MAVKNKRRAEESSFRDPNGYVYWRQGQVYRQVNIGYKDNYDQLVKSGLYKKLANKGLLIEHREIKKKITGGIYKIIKPTMIPFVSYPYEWSFGQLKAAALLTLAIEKISLGYDMSLKDASAYNIQFVGTKAVFIDSLSFEKYKQGQAWVAYRQFCRHFLAPLTLMAKKDVRLGQLLKIYIDGLPLDLVDNLLPLKAKFDFGILAHIKLNAKSELMQIKKSQKEVDIPKKALISLIENLESTTKKLNLKETKSEWGNYYKETNYLKKAFRDKKKMVGQYLAKTKAKTVIDLGANNGEFSKIASNLGAYTISVDIDEMAVEQNYKNFADKKMTILPLLIDLVNPSPGLGWENVERKSFLKRVKVDTVMALALIHHLAISNNLPFEKIAKTLAKMGKWLIIEFVAKNDSQVKRMLEWREDIFDDYNQDSFEKAFGRYYKVVTKKRITGSFRWLYLMQVKT